MLDYRMLILGETPPLRGGMELPMLRRLSHGSKERVASDQLGADMIKSL